MSRYATPHRRTAARHATVIAVAAAAMISCTSRPRESAPHPDRGIFRVATYNIHAGKDASQRPNLDRVAAVIDSLGADIVLLQEVDRGTERSGGVDQVAEL